MRTLDAVDPARVSGFQGPHRVAYDPAYVESMALQKDLSRGLREAARIYNLMILCSWLCLYDASKPVLLDPLQFLSPRQLVGSQVGVAGAIGVIHTRISVYVVSPEIWKRRWS